MHTGQTARIPPFPLSYLLPSDTTSFYRYLGSLTTPPCSEVVVWTVFVQKLFISDRQVSSQVAMNQLQVLKWRVSISCVLLIKVTSIHILSWSDEYFFTCWEGRLYPACVYEVTSAPWCVRWTSVKGTSILIILREGDDEYTPCFTWRWRVY